MVMKTDAEQFREKLGARLVIVSTVAVTVLGIAAIISAAADRENAELRSTIQLVFTSLLPLLGTWVGSVLAFYYSKESTQAATASTLDIVKSVSQRLSATKVSDYMMPLSKIINIPITNGSTIGDLKVAEVEGYFMKSGTSQSTISRLLILKEDKSCVAILHRSIFYEMLAKGLNKTPTVDRSTWDLNELLGETYPKVAPDKYIDFIQKTVAFVAEDRSMADAKGAMESLQSCQDVIVTKTGKSTDPVIGWVSNVDITRASQA